MGLFERIFGNRQQTLAARKTFELLDGYRPSFHTWQGSIFESDLIRASLDAHGRHAAKLSVNIAGSAKPNLRSRLLVQPNEFQTWPQFLYRTAVILYAKNTAFVVPVLGEYGEPNGVISVVPRSWELVEDRGVPYIRFTFDNNKRRAVELWNVGILTSAQGLIAQAARIRVRLNELSADIDEHGMTEMFQQSEKCMAYTRTRPEAELFVKLDKNYQSLIKQLDSMIPHDEAPAVDVFDCD